MELLSSVSSGGGSAITNLIPGFADYGPAFMSLLNNFLGFMVYATHNIKLYYLSQLQKCSIKKLQNFY
jgi:hypothetical protein